MALLGKIFRLLRMVVRSALFDRQEKRFVRHNRQAWRHAQALAENSPHEILVEVFPVASAIVSQSYLANVLAEKHQARIVGYDPFRTSWVKRIYSWPVHRIYRSFQTKSFFSIELSAAEAEQATQLADRILSELKTKKDVEDLCVEGVWVGDLLYDSHLKKYQVPTVEIADPRFRESLTDCLRFYVFWRNYMDRHSVKAVLVSHCVYYENAVVVRLCIARGISAYQVNAISLYSLNKKNVRAYNEYLYFPEEFQRLPLEERERGLAQAKERLALRFQGKVGVDMHYSTKSAYANVKDTPLLKKSDKLKVLIAAHCFFDSPHPYGNNLFPDFYEWLDFLGKISERTDYEWYIKTHPDVLPGNYPVLSAFETKYPKLMRLPSDSSHLQLIQEGIGVVLTVYGTIGSEYSALGKPVVNASLSNPHVAYNFNVHVGDIREYERILLNLKDLNLQIDKEKVWEYYFMSKLNKSQNWLYSNYRKFLSDIGGYKKQIEPVAYEYFLNEFSSGRHEEIRSVLSRFVDSGEYFLSARFVK